MNWKVAHACLVPAAGLAVLMGPLAAMAAADPGELSEIVVTAQRRSEDLQRTPIAVTAISSETLENLSVKTSADLVQAVPSLQLSTQVAGDGGASATFFLRGMGEERSGNGAQPAVGIYIDGFYYPSLEGDVFNILDISQIEVLRGPQGTLFGRNTIGGAILYTTKKPDQTLSADVSATYGSFGRNDFTDSFNLPITDVAALRVTLGHLDSNGYVTLADGQKAAGGGDSALARAQLRIQLRSDLTIDLETQYNRSRYDGFAYYLSGPFNNGQISGVWNMIPPLNQGHLYDSSYASSCPYCAPGNNDYSNVKSYGGHGVVAWNITDAISLKFLSGLQVVTTDSLSDIDGTPLPIFSILTSGDTRAVSQELQLTGRSFEDALSWVAGAYYYDERYQQSGIDGVGNVLLGGTTAPTPTNRKIINDAGYFDLTWKVAGGLSVLGGYRYSIDHVTQSDVTPPAQPGGAPVGYHAAAKFSSSTGRLGAQYQFTPDMMSYLTVSQGFRAGGFDLLQSGDLQRFQPETSTTYELGARLMFFDRTLRINPTVFYTQWKDIQVQQIVYPINAPAGQFLVELINAARAHTDGIEIEAEDAITERLHVFAHLATLNAKYDHLNYSAAPLPVSLNSRFQDAPSFSYGLGASYQQPLGKFGNLTGTVNFSHQSDEASTPTDTPTPGAPADTLLLRGYGLTNIRLEYAAPGDHVSVAGFVTNLTNQRYFAGGVNYPETSAQYYLGRPRELGVKLRVKF